MDKSRPTIWLEDLEGHREPALYYLTSEDEPAGPHLICDWNGPPTNYEEFDIDLICKMIECTPMNTNKHSSSDNSASSDINQYLSRTTLDNKEQQTQGVFIDDNVEFNNQQQDDSQHPYHTILPETSRSPNNLLVENDGSRLEFLTVPPLVASLLKRQLQLQAKVMAQNDKPFTIAEEESETECSSKSGNIKKKQT